MARVSHPPPRRPRQPEPPTPTPPGPQRGPNSIARGLMNSRTLIGSPGALRICSGRLLSAVAVRRPGSFPQASAWGLAGGSGRRGSVPAASRPRPGLTSGPRALSAIVASRRLPASLRLSGEAPPAAPPEAGAQSRSPRPPPEPPSPGQRCPRGKAGPGRAPASPFSPDSFDPRAPRRTSAPGLPGSARGGPGNRPQLISFHQAALGALKPRSQ